MVDILAAWWQTRDMDEETLKEAMRIVGKRGGDARAGKLTPERRSAIARKASLSRPVSCQCGECLTCKRREYQRRHRAKKNQKKVP